MIEFGYLSHPGLRRKRNEDTGYGDSELKLWLIADGMGDEGVGEIASALAREIIVSAVRNGVALQAALHLAAEEVTRFSRQQRRAGTTVVAAQIQHDQLEIAVAGDCRAYLWHEQRLIRLGQEPIDKDKLPLSSKRAEQLCRLVATQAMGITEPEQLHLLQMKHALQPGMKLVLCSDGLSDALDENSLTSILNEARYNAYSAQECVDRLVAAALDNGGEDNISVIVVYWH